MHLVNNRKKWRLYKILFKTLPSFHKLSHLLNFHYIIFNLMRLFYFFYLLLIMLSFRKTCPSPKIFTDLSPNKKLSEIKWSSSCTESAQNLSEAFEYPSSYNTDCSFDDSYGPKPINYPIPSIPFECDEVIWQQLRIVEVIQYVTNLNLNFCHHYCPDWVPTENSGYRIEIESDSETILNGCLREERENLKRNIYDNGNFKQNEKEQILKERNIIQNRLLYQNFKENAKKTKIKTKMTDEINNHHFKEDNKNHSLLNNNPLERSKFLQDFLQKSNYYKKKSNSQNIFQGLDSPNFVSFIYNFALGAYLTPNLDDLACGEQAPGKILNISADITSEVDKLNPGDLIFIVKNERISRVLIWTGIIATKEGIFGIETILENYLESKRQMLKKDTENFLKNNENIYIIADSSNMGPNFRLFTGEYISSFGFVRRIVRGNGGSFLGRTCDDLNGDLKERVNNSGYIWGKNKKAEKVKANIVKDNNINIEVVVKRNVENKNY